MPTTPHTHGTPGADRHPGHRVHALITVMSLTVGRGAAARAVADLAALGSDDHVVDVGCGPGTAVRHAARRGATAVGVDPSRASLRLGRWITAVRRLPNVTFVPGRAESLPLPENSATVVWALRSVHHWADRRAGLREGRRVLSPGGRILLAECLVKPGEHGGVTRDQADALAQDLAGAGFDEVRVETRTARQQTLLIVRGVRPALAE